MIETLVKLAAGLLLVLTPRMVSRVFGLDIPSSGFWPRMLGGVLLGLAAATAIEGARANPQGLGLAGAAAINLISAGTIAALLILNRAAPSRRGTVLLWLVVTGLTLLSLFEIAWI